MPSACVLLYSRRPSPTARRFSSQQCPPPPPVHHPLRPPDRRAAHGSADRHMTQPPRRPTTTAEPVFLGATSIPSPRPDPATDIPTFLHPPPPPPPQKHQHGSSKHRSRPARLIRSVRAAFRSFPILPAPSCRGLPSLPHLPSLNGAVRFHGSTRTTGTLYGRRRSRITIAFHDSPSSPPGLLLEMCVATAKFIQDVSAAGMVRVTLECDKKQQQQYQHQQAGEAALPPRRLLDEPVWAAEVNGESVGYASRREATEEDQRVMRLLHATSMGAGVLPDDMADPANGEITYMRAHFDRVVGSKDSETYYMHNLEGTATGPELTIFFVRN